MSSVAPSPSVSPADRASQVVEGRIDGAPVLGTLSPSRAGDFMTCPLLYRFRAIDQLPEEPSPDAVRGTVVHKVLEELFDLPAADRTPERAGQMLPTAWERLLEEEPALGEMFDEATRAPDVTSWLSSCVTVLSRYFTLEDPRRLEPAEREVYVEALLESGLLLRGFIDRLDVAPNGMIRVVDYKTGRSPSPMFEARALFQMKFYALALWRARGVVPTVLQLVYLGNGEILRYEPDEQDLRATERKVTAVWRAIRRAEETGDWRPSPSRLCDWCSHQALCPAFGGTPPPLPGPSVREGQQPVEAQAVEGVGEDPALTVQDRDVIGHTEHDPAAGRDR